MSRQHKYHYIYKTTCNVTKRYYIGMHSTSNLNDGYIGSGRRLWLSINKHSKENHSTEILEWLPDRSSLKLREKELVNESLLSDPMCMNLQLGGGGGLSGEEHRAKWIKAGSAAGNAKLKELWNDPSYAKARSEKVKEIMSDPNIKERALAGFNKCRHNKHTEETKKKIGLANSVKQSGEFNSQFGTRWITNGSNNMKIKKTESLPDGWSYGRTQKSLSRG